MQARNEELLRKILASDPIIGDVACQNRAVYLAYLFQKISRQKVLNNDEIEFINLASNLSEILIAERSPCDLVKDFKTPSMGKLPAKFPAEACSNKKKQTYLGESKAKIADLALQFMQRKAQKMRFEDPVLDVNENAEEIKRFMGSTGSRIPVFPFYSSIKMALNIINRRKIDIVAVVRYVDTDNETLLAKQQILYQYTENGYKPQLGEVQDLGNLEGVNKKKEAILFEFVETYNQKKARIDFDEFIETFKQKDILKMIMIYGGNHSQYPLSTEKMVPASLAFLKNTAVNLAARAPFDINTCSVDEFEAYKLKSSRAGINRNDKFVDHVSITCYRPIKG